MKMDSRYENLASQKLYGELLGKLVNLGILLLATTFGVYVFGVFDPLVPMEKLPQVWQLSLGEFLVETGAPTGWDWVGQLGRGDYLTVLAIAFLASVSLMCYAVILFRSLVEKQKVFSWIIGAELCLILLAASHLLKSGGH